LKTTILLSITAILFGIVLGGLATLLRRSKYGFLRAIGYTYVDVIRGTPSMMQLLVINFVVFASVNVDLFVVGTVAFGLNSGAYISEIFRAGILSIDKGQTEAGRSLGLSSSQTMTYIILPQAIKNILPALANEFIMLIKETAIVGYIAMHDLTKAGDIIRSLTYDAYMPLLAVALLYYLLVKTLTLGIEWLERYLRASDMR
jgi:His/Glu/Gln/Arg/opine family amino acid ABC transporter permease subunit